MGGVCSAEGPAFRLGISGQPVDGDGFEIESLAQGSALQFLKDDKGQILTATPGDRVLTLNGDSFSPDALQAKQQDLLKSNGVVDLVLFDAQTGQQGTFTAVLRRADLGRLGDRFRNIVRQDYEGVENAKLSISEKPESVIALNLESVFAPRSETPATPAPTPLSMIATAQAGVDYMRAAARKQNFQQMVPQGTYDRADSILENAVAVVSLNPEGEQSAAIAKHAQEAVATEFRTSFECYASLNRKRFLEESTYGATFVFRPLTRPPLMTVEVIPSADVKLILLANPNTADGDIDQLSAWTPLPTDKASLYGRFFYRVRNPNTGDLVFGYQRSKFIVIIRSPTSGEILFP